MLLTVDSEHEFDGIIGGLLLVTDMLVDGQMEEGVNCTSFRSWYGDDINSEVTSGLIRTLAFWT